jgi:hypothetical protein
MLHLKIKKSYFILKCIGFTGKINLRVILEKVQNRYHSRLRQPL